MPQTEVAMKTRTPVYEQQAPVGLHTREELEAMGLRPGPGELPRGLLKIWTADSERMTGVFDLEQTEPIRARAVSA